MNKLDERTVESSRHGNNRDSAFSKTVQRQTDFTGRSDPKSQQILFWRKLSLHLSSGVPVIESLNAIAEELSSSALVAAIHDLREKVRQGTMMSDAMKEHLDVFSLSACAMAAGGEQAGNLDIICAKIADAIESGATGIGDPSAAPGIAAARTGPGAEQVRNLIADAVRARASDVHIEPFANETRVRYRIDGVLHNRRTLSNDEYKRIRAEIMTLARMDLGLAWTNQTADGRVEMEISPGAVEEETSSAKEPVDIRVSAIPTVHGQTIVARLPRREVAPQSVNDLGLSDENLAMVKRWRKRNAGAIIWTGPTGSGKTTSLYALIREFDGDRTKVVTVENPVEHDIEGVIQSEARPSAGLTFANLIRAQLKQAPDVVMIGDVRDSETAQLLLQTATAGRLVLATLQTDDAPSALRRMLDMRLEPFVINDAIIGVACQRLVRMLCDECKEVHAVPKSQLDEFGLSGGDIEAFKASGCEKCAQTGYRGRTAIHEMFELNDDIRRAIGEDAPASALHELAKASGMKTMRQDALEKALKGITSFEEVVRVTGRARD